MEAKTLILNNYILGIGYVSELSLFIYRDYKVCWVSSLLSYDIMIMNVMTGYDIIIHFFCVITEVHKQLRFLKINFQQLYIFLKFYNTQNSAITSESELWGVYLLRVQIDLVS